MGENQDNITTVSPGVNVDFSPTNEKLGEIKEELKKLNDYLVPTKEDLQEQQKIDKQNDLKLQEENKLQIEKEKKQIEYDTKVMELTETTVDTNLKILEQLTILNDSINKGNEVNAISSGNGTIIVTVLVSIVFFGLMYKAIRAFI